MKLQRFSFIFALIFLFTFSAFAQTTKPTPTPKVEDDDGVLEIKSRLVIVPVSVLDAAGQPVLGLKAQDFRILEENRPQEIAQISDAEKVPLEIALLIDVSGSINPLFEFEKKAAAQFLQSVMKPEDHATIFLIGDKPILTTERENAAQAAIRVQAITLSGKFTAFYDTVTLAANYLQKNAPQRSRRVILALTDGEDNWSNLTRQAEASIDVNSLTAEKLNQAASKTDKAHEKAQSKVLRDLQNADTVFYSINPAGNSFKLNKISTRAQNGMQKFADDTGGTAYLPNFLPVNLKDQMQNSQNSKRNVDTLQKIFRQLTNELQAQYLVQYYSESEYPVNRYVNLNVNLQNPQNFRLRARKGYFVKN
ncbi:MAG TPA: VWA domain-containing protein [Pyrinomonadaceae bacterium]